MGLLAITSLNTCLAHFLETVRAGLEDIMRQHKYMLRLSTQSEKNYPPSNQAEAGIKNYIAQHAR